MSTNHRLPRGSPILIVSPQRRVRFLWFQRSPGVRRRLISSLSVTSVVPFGVNAIASARLSWNRLMSVWRK